MVKKLYKTIYLHKKIKTLTTISASTSGVSVSMSLSEIEIKSENVLPMNTL